MRAKAQCTALAPFKRLDGALWVKEMDSDASKGGDCTPQAASKVQNRMVAFQITTCKCIGVWSLQGNWLDRAIGPKAHIHKVPHRAFRHSGEYALVVKAIHIDLRSK